MHTCMHSRYIWTDFFIVHSCEKTNTHTHKKETRKTVTHVSVSTALLKCVGSARHMLSGGIICVSALDVSLRFIELLILVTGLTFMTRSGANEMKRGTREEQVGEGVIA